MGKKLLMLLGAFLVIYLLNFSIRLLMPGDPFDYTRQMGLWSMVPAENSACYRKVTVEIIQAGIVERKYYFPNAFVVNYDEDFGDTDGVGTFRLTIKQKKDKIKRLLITHGHE